MAWDATRGDWGDESSRREAVWSRVHCRTDGAALHARHPSGLVDPEPLPVQPRFHLAGFPGTYSSPAGRLAFATDDGVAGAVDVPVRGGAPSDVLDLPVSGRPDLVLRAPRGDLATVDADLRSTARSLLDGAVPVVPASAEGEHDHLRALHLAGANGEPDVVAVFPPSWADPDSVALVPAAAIDPSSSGRVDLARFGGPVFAHALVDAAAFADVLATTRMALVGLDHPSAFPDPGPSLDHDVRKAIFDGLDRDGNLVLHVDATTLHGDGPADAMVVDAFRHDFKDTTGLHSGPEALRSVASVLDQSAGHGDPVVAMPLLLDGRVAAGRVAVADKVALAGGADPGETLGAALLSVVDRSRELLARDLSLAVGAAGAAFPLRLDRDELAAMRSGTAPAGLMALVPAVRQPEYAVAGPTGRTLEGAHGVEHLAATFGDKSTDRKLMLDPAAATAALRAMSHGALLGAKLAFDESELRDGRARQRLEHKRESEARLDHMLAAPRGASAPSR